MAKKKRIVIALGGNALGNTLPEQMAAVKITAKAIVDLIEEGCEVVVAHGNGPQVGMVNNAMIVLTHEDKEQPNTPLSVCVAMSQAYIGYDLQNALREELLNRDITDIPVATMITQVRVDENDPAFQSPSKPIGKFVSAEQAREMVEKYDYIMKEDSGRGYRRVVAFPKPVEIIEIGTILTAVEKVAINFGKPEEKWLGDLSVDEARQYMEEGHFAPGSMLPKVQAALDFASSKEGRTALITLLEKAREAVRGTTGTTFHL